MMQVQGEIVIQRPAKNVFDFEADERNRYDPGSEGRRRSRRGLRGLVLALHLAAGIVILACAVAVAFAPSVPG